MTPYTDLTIDQLRSAILQRDDQLRVALGDVEKWKSMTVKFESTLEGTCRDLTTAQKELNQARTALELCRTALRLFGCVRNQMLTSTRSTKAFDAAVSAIEAVDKS